jgi:hypothetical protein
MSLFCQQFVGICIATCEIIIIVLFCLFLVYLLILESTFIIGLHFQSLWLGLIGFLVLKELKESKLWGKRRSEFFRVKNLDFMWNTRGVMIYFMPLIIFYRFKICIKITSIWHQMLMVLSKYELLDNNLNFWLRWPKSWKMILNQWSNRLVGLIAKEVISEGLYEMLKLILMSLLMITQMWVMMTISLYL